MDMVGQGPVFVNGLANKDTKEVDKRELAGWQELEEFSKKEAVLLRIYMSVLQSDSVSFRGMPLLLYCAGIL